MCTSHYSVRCYSIEVFSMKSSPFFSVYVEHFHAVIFPLCEKGARNSSPDLSGVITADGNVELLLLPNKNWRGNIVRCWFVFDRAVAIVCEVVGNIFRHHHHNHRHHKQHE